MEWLSQHLELTLSNLKSLGFPFPNACSPSRGTIFLLVSQPRRLSAGFFDFFFFSISHFYFECSQPYHFPSDLPFVLCSCKCILINRAKITESLWFGLSTSPFLVFPQATPQSVTKQNFYRDSPWYEPTKVNLAEASILDSAARNIIWFYPAHSAVTDSASIAL